ncbi:hypothetical protein Pelo_18894 [Pelomyxa schiedti]|nr:hypothetical protein Pelo_18894 [Pelomyxa schiedti]
MWEMLKLPGLMKNSISPIECLHFDFLPEILASSPHCPAGNSLALNVGELLTLITHKACQLATSEEVGRYGYSLPHLPHTHLACTRDSDADAHILLEGISISPRGNAEDKCSSQLQLNYVTKL